MINRKSVTAIYNSKFEDNFIKPLYNTYCFSNVPQTIKNILLNQNKKALPNNTLPQGNGKFDKVILFLIDGFGWKFFKKYENKYPFLKFFENEGVVSKLTSQFPPTTPNQLTTIHTGLPVGAHGNYEWFHYLPELDTIIAPLLFSFAGKRIRNTLLESGINPKEIYPQKTLYQELKNQNISSYIFLSNEYANSAYTKSVMNGASIIPFNNLIDALHNFTNHILKNKEKSYYFFYWGNIDQAAHLCGPESLQFQNEIDYLFSNMQRFFMEESQNRFKNTLLMLTADHGETAIDPSKTIYLNKEFPGIKKWIKQNEKGELLVPAGACRDMFLHIKENYLQEAYTFLKKHLRGKAKVYLVNDLIKKGFFGKNITNKLLERVGNIVILCLNHESVWWYEKDKFEITYYGHHGSLTKDEMEIPLMCKAL